MYFKTHESEIKSIMRVCGLSSKTIICLSGHLARLERENGIEYTISVLKARFHALLSGNDQFHRENGFWRGPFRQISVIAKRGRSGLRKALKVLRLHGVFYAPEASLKDYANAQRELSVTGRPVLDKLYPKEFLNHFKGIHHHYDDRYPMSSSRAPMGSKTMPDIWALPIDHIRSMDYFSAHVARHYPYYRILVGKDLPSKAYFLRYVRRRRACFRNDPKHARQFYVSKRDIAGRVTILNTDCSFKQRLVANANRVLQLACSPVHNFTMAFLKEHPSSYVFNQEGGIEWIRRQLAAGHSLSSIDLKSASDNIPLGPQIRFLKEIVPALAKPLDVFYEVSRMEFLTPFDRIRIKWSCGSPMGVKGSFGLFTVFLMSIFEDAGARKSYAIVGDDIVVQSRFSAVVLNSLNYYNIPVSKHKSLFNHNRFAEFCGKIIDAQGSFDVYKNPLPNMRTDPTGLLSRYGKRAFRFFPLYGLRSSQLWTLQKFHDLTKMGVIQSLAVLDPKGSRDYEPLNEGGLSSVQVARLLTLNDRELRILAPIEGARSPSEAARYRSLLRRKSKEAVNLLQDSDHSNITAWKIVSNDPLLTGVGNLVRKSLDGELDPEIRKNATSYLDRLRGTMNSGATDVSKIETDVFLDKVVRAPHPFQDRKLSLHEVNTLVKRGVKLVKRFKQQCSFVFEKFKLLVKTNK